MYYYQFFFILALFADYGKIKNSILKDQKLKPIAWPSKIIIVENIQ